MNTTTTEAPNLNDYITCALWSSTHIEDDNDSCGIPFDEIDAELAPEARAQMNEDLTAFMAEVAVIQESQDWPEFPSDEQIAHDFWLTRNRHGAGFWDRGLGDLGELLTDAAHAWGESDLYLGDDNQIYVS